MRTIDRTTKVSRRVVLRGGAMAIPGAAVALTITPGAAWAAAAKNLPPATLTTLARAARDIYPHDRIGDAHYIAAVAGYDSAAPEVRELLTAGCASLDQEAQKRHGVAYILVGHEDDRVAILKSIESTPFFGKLRSDLVVTLYNQPSIWPKFGYEGSSADKGGYLHRGFNDIDWLDNA